jgi:flagellar motor switch protein FliG
MVAASTIHQVAKLFLILGEEIAAQLIQRLPKETARKILRSLSQLGPVSETEMEVLANEFLALLNDPRASLLVDQNETGRRILELCAKVTNDPTFVDSQKGGMIEREIRELLDVLPMSLLASWAGHESVQVLAVVTSLMSPQNAAQFFRRLEKETQLSLTIAIAKLEHIYEETLETLLEELQSLDAKREKGMGAMVAGVDKLKNVFTEMDPQFREELLSKLEAKDEALSQSIRHSLLTLAKLTTLPVPLLSQVSMAFTERQLAMVIYTESTQIKEAILNTLSKNRRAEVEEEIKNGKFRQSEVNNAQKNFCNEGRRLKEAGRIYFPWEDAMVG